MTTGETKLHVGILIIGSLFWDTADHREQWRRSRLKMDEAFSVTAAIRYGRRSTGRGNTYTMVFSPGCPKGQAKVVPCSNQVSRVGDLITEAEHLWIAESRDRPIRVEPTLAEAEHLWIAESRDGRPINGLSASWGCVALLVNHKFNDCSILEGWANHVSTETNYAELAGCKPVDGSAVDQNGLLQIAWPELIDGSGPVPLDILLATATKPTLENRNYPSVNCVAEAWKRDQGGYVDYFCFNRKHGIQTFQDDEILQHLRS